MGIGFDATVAIHLANEIRDCEPATISWEPRLSGGKRLVIRSVHGTVYLNLGLADCEQLVKDASRGLPL